jgi:hypothetical protein
MIDVRHDESGSVLPDNRCSNQYSFGRNGACAWPLLQRFDPSFFVRGDPRLTTDRWSEVGAEHRARCEFYCQA